MNEKLKRIIFIVLNVLILLVLIFSGFYLISANIIFNGTNGIVAFGKTEYITVNGEYMHGDLTDYSIPTLENGSLVIVEKTDKKNQQDFYASLRVGDIVKAEKQLFRIQAIEQREGVYFYLLRCDNSIHEISCRSVDNIIEGKAVEYKEAEDNIFAFVRKNKALVYLCVVYCLLCCFYCIGFGGYLFVRDKFVFYQMKIERQESEIMELTRRLHAISNDWSRHEPKNSNRR